MLRQVLNITRRLFELMPSFKSSFLLSFLFLMFDLCRAQNPDIKRTWHWYFGDGAGIDFSSGTAVADTNGHLYTSEGCASISDISGNLLFYTDGRTVWNHLHQVMPNGTGLMGGALGSSTQEALIIPKPLSPNLYYLFTTDEAENYGANGMQYSIVDMNLDSGNGDVTATKNVLLFAPCTEKLAAVNHCNDTCVWVMGHEVNNNHFRAYLVTPNGIDTNAVVSAVGFSHNNNVFGGLNGVLKFSPNGEKLCTATDSLLSRVQLFHFDSFSGIVFNPITLSTTDNFSYAISFSPDNSKLYVGKISWSIFQYELVVDDSAAIINSKILINENIDDGYRYLQNSPLGNQIVLHAGGIDSLISVINNPNAQGQNCDLTLFSINLMNPGGGGGLPNFNESYFNQSVKNGCFTSSPLIQSTWLKIIPNPAHDWISVRGFEINSIQLVDVFGRVCINKDSNHSTQEYINIASLPRGVYFIIISSGKQMLSQKIILN